MPHTGLTSSAQQNPEIKEQVSDTPELRAEKVKEAYEKAPEEKGFLDKGKEFIKSGIEGMFKDFHEKNWGSLISKSLLLGVGLWGASKAVEMVHNTIKKPFEWFGEKTGLLKESGEWGILGVVLKGLGLTASASVIRELITKDGNLGVSEIFDAWKEDGTVGVAKLLLGSAIAWPKDIAKSLGEMVTENETVQEVSNDVKEFLDENPGVLGFAKGVVDFVKDTAGSLKKDITETLPKELQYLLNGDVLNDIASFTPISFVTDLLSSGIKEEDLKKWSEGGKTALGAALTAYLMYKFVRGGKITKTAVVAFLTYGFYKKSTNFEKAVDALVESPKELLEKWKKGEIAFEWTSAGEILLHAGKSLNLPLQLFNLSQSQFEAFQAHLQKEDPDWTPALASVGGSVILASMSWEAMKSYKYVWESGEGVGAVFRTIKTMVPGSKEFKFVMRSAFLGIPGVKKSLELHQANKVGKIKDYLTQLEKELSKSPLHTEEIQKITNEMREIKMKDIEEIRETMKGSSFGYKFLDRFQNFKSDIDTVRTEAIKGDVKGAQKFIRKLQGDISEYETGLSRLIARARLIATGNFEAAFKLESSQQSQIQEKLESQKLSPEAEKYISGKTEAQIERRVLRLETQAELSAKEVQELRILKAYTTGVVPVLDEDLFDALDERAKAKQLEEFAEEMLDAEKGLNARVFNEMDKVKQFAIDNNLPLDDPKIKEKFVKIEEDIIGPFAQNKAENIKMMNKRFKSLPDHLRTAELADSMKKAIYENSDSLFVRVKKGMVGRMKVAAVMGALMVGVDTAMNFEAIKNDPARELAELLQHLGPEMVQILIDVLPFVGTYSNFHSAIAGEELYTENDVSSGMQRFTNTLFGVGGAIADVLTVVSFGAGVPANIAARLAVVAGKMGSRGVRMAKALESLIPKFGKLAEKMGGWKEFGKNFVDIVTTKKSSLEKVAKYSNYGGMATVVGTMGVGVFYSNAETFTEDELDPMLQ